MINGYKIVIVTPAGRQRYMEILIEYILRERDIIDEYRIWVNTKNNDDINYFNYLKEKYPDFITLDFDYFNEVNCGHYTNIRNFFKNCIDEDTVYIRLDDDIIWVQENFIKTISEYRIKNNSAFLVFGTIINNVYIDNILQNLGYYDEHPKFSLDRFDENGWRNPYVCERKHNYFLENYFEKNKTPEKKFEEIILKYDESVSINCISWRGDDFKKFNGEITHILKKNR